MIKMRFFGAICLLAALVTGCTGTPSARYIEGGVWHTVYHITYIGGTAALEDSVIAEMTRVENSLSAFNPASTVSRVNAAPSATVAADALLRRCIEGSARVSALSSGAFDPTVGPLVSLWGFGPAAADSAAPSPEAVALALRSVGMDRCYVDSAGRVVKKSDETAFNFSAIAKGMGCDAIAEMFLRNGVADFMVEIGGEIVTHGLNPRREPWRIQVDAPVASDTGVVHSRLAVITPGDGAVATSGNYRNYRTTADGVRAVHTISPRTGMPLVTATLSATVIAPDCMTADALATACMAMPPDSAIAMIRATPHTEALLVIDASPDSAYRLLKTPGFVFR